MKHATVALAVLLLAMAASPALADSVPLPPVTSFTTTGTVMQGYFNSPSSYDLIGSNITNSGVCAVSNPCLVFEVANGPGIRIGSIKDNSAQLWGFTSATEGGNMFGNLVKVSFNPQTDILSGVFKGREQLVAHLAGIPDNKWPNYWYHVEGTFTENLATGAGSLNLTSETFLKTTTVPEPGTLLTLGTGLCAMAGVVRRKLRTL
jgi:PEP-CTERM motif